MTEREGITQLEHRIAQLVAENAAKDQQIAQLPTADTAKDGQIAQLQERMGALEAQVPHLLGRLAKESPNSSKSPYGPRVRAVAVYLNPGQLLPEARTCAALADLLGGARSAGTLGR
jgi:uncharacterized coiled-coil protein SlyX